MAFSGEFYLTKVPILDKHKKIFGYFLSIKDYEDKPVSVKELADILVHTDLKKLSGNYPVFLKVEPEILTHDILDYLPADQIIFLLDTFSLSDELIAIIKELKKEFFRFSFVYDSDFEKVKDLADYIFVNIDDIDSQIYMLKDKAIITEIYTMEEFNDLVNEGFKYFKGDFIFKPATIVEKKINPSKLAVMELFTKVRENFNPKEIEELIKRNPDLSISLLRYVNSAAFSFRSKITSIRHAISILGQRNLLQWLLLFLYRTGESEPFAETLLEVSAERGKTMEILAQQIGLPDEETEKAFLVGILSLVDKLLGVSPEKLGKELNLDEEIVNAISQKEGILGELLFIVEKTEEGKIGEASDIIEKLGLHLNDVMSAQLKAFAWFEEINLV
ncbi:HDOD domain-containing protein [Persephonella sp.]|uniref:EAL and HDOD domain-containing protein n=1 Tax=Persephonella sp. TaxID=2060922 RepID=UPI00260E090F|nr:HDOD domain-containing protein [Persephonella sp.]